MMKKKAMVRKMAAGLAMVSLLSPVCIGMSTPIPVYAAVDQSAETLEATTYWVYKVVDGVTYMRLYDKTNGVWLTDWIKCS